MGTQGFSGRAVFGGRGGDRAPWRRITMLAASLAVLPPVADISAPSAVPAGVRARLNGSFLGIDDLYVRTQPVPRAYIDEAGRIVAAKTHEYVRWLEGVA